MRCSLFPRIYAAYAQIQGVLVFKSKLSIVRSELGVIEHHLRILYRENNLTVKYKDYPLIDD